MSAVKLLFTLVQSQMQFFWGSGLSVIDSKKSKFHYRSSSDW